LARTNLTRSLVLTKADEQLIPPHVRALYAAGVIDKKELDTYIGKVADDTRVAYESNFQPGMLQPPAPKEEKKEAPWGPKEGQFLAGKAIEVNEQIKGLNDEFESARAEDNRLAYLDALINDPGFYEKELEAAQAESSFYNDPNAPVSGQDRLMALRGDLQEAKRLSASGELWDRRNKAFAKQQELNQKLQSAEVDLKGIEDYFSDQGAYGQRLLADVGSNKESLYPLAGGLIGGAVAGPKGAVLGSAIGAAPMYDLAYDASYTRAIRGGVPEDEARQWASVMAGSEAVIEAVAGKFGSASAPARTLIKDEMVKRFGQKAAQAAFSEGAEGLITSGTQEALGAGFLASDQTSEQLKDVAASQVPMRDDGSVDWEAYIGGKAREFAAGAAAGGALRGTTAPLEMRAENKAVQSRVDAGKSAFAQTQQAFQSGIINENDLITERQRLAAALQIEPELIADNKSIADLTVRRNQSDLRKITDSVANELVQPTGDASFDAGQQSAVNLSNSQTPAFEVPLEAPTSPFKPRSQEGQWGSSGSVLGAAPEAPVQPESTISPALKQAIETSPFIKRQARPNLTEAQKERTRKVTEIAAQELYARGADVTDQAVKTRAQELLADKEQDVEKLGQRVASEILGKGRGKPTLSNLVKAKEGEITRQVSRRSADVAEAAKDLTRFLSQEDTDNLIKSGVVTLKPTIKDEKGANVQGETYRGKFDINVESIKYETKDGKTTVRNPKARQALLEAVASHEGGHLRDFGTKGGKKVALLANLAGDTAINKLNSVIEAESKKQGGLGDIARNALERANKQTDNPAREEIATYFVEELTRRGYEGRLGPVWKAVDNLVAGARNTFSKVTGKTLDIRLKDLGYIAKQELKQAAKRGVETNNDSTTKKSIAYGITSQKAREEIAAGGGFVDPVYGRKAVEISDKNASVNPQNLVMGSKVGDSLNHRVLYEYYPKIKNYNLSIDNTFRPGEASFNPYTNTVTVSGKTVNTLQKAQGALYKKAERELISSIIHETQHGIQASSVPYEKGTNKRSEVAKYEKRSILTQQIEMDKARRELRSDNAAWWMYMANAGEAQARAVQAVFEGEYDNYQDAIKAISDQFPTLIRDAKDRDAFIDWWNKQVKEGKLEDETGNRLRSIADDSEQNPVTKPSYTFTRPVVDIAKGLFGTNRPAEARIAEEAEGGYIRRKQEEALNIVNGLKKAMRSQGLNQSEVDEEWNRMNLTQTDSSEDEFGNVALALNDLRKLIDDLSWKIIDIYEQSGIPVSEKNRKGIEANIGGYISRSFDINFDKNYGKKLLKKAAVEGSVEERIVEDLEGWLQTNIVDSLNNLDSLSDAEIDSLYKKLIGETKDTLGKLNKKITAATEGVENTGFKDEQNALKKSAEKLEGKRVALRTAKQQELENFRGFVSDESLTKTLRDDLLRIGKKSNLASYYAGAARNEGILKYKEMIPEIILKAWGERTGAVESALTTIMRQSKLVASTQFQMDLLARSPDSFGEARTETLNAQLSKDKGKYGPLAGMYVTPEMKTYLESHAVIQEELDTLLYQLHTNAGQEALATKAFKGLFKKWEQAGSLYKASTVLGNPINYAYNIVALGQNTISNALPARDLTYTDTNGEKVNTAKWVRQFLGDVAGGTISSSTGEVYRDAIEFDFLGAGLSGDLQDAFQKDVRQFMAETSTANQAVDKIVSGLKTSRDVMFTLPELIGTVVNFVNEQNYLRKLWTAEGREFTERELKMEAADRTKKTSMNRGRAFPVAKLLDRTQLTTFLTFFAETGRATVGGFLTGISDMRHASDLRSQGKTEAADLAFKQGSMRVAGGLAMFGLTQAMLAGLAKTIGHKFGEEDDEKKEYLPEDQRANLPWLVVVGETKEGTKKIFDVSKLDTYSALSNPIVSLLRGEPANAASQVSDLAFMNPLLSMAYKQFVVGEVRSREDTAWVNELAATTGLANVVDAKTLDALTNVAVGVTPPVIKRSLTEAISPTEDIGGQMARFLTYAGSYLMEVNPKTQYPSSLNRVKTELDAARQELNRVMTKENISEEAARTYIRKYHNRLKEIVDKESPLIQGAVSAGEDKKRIKQLATGIDKGVQESLFNGIYKPKEMSKTWLNLSELNKEVGTPEEKIKIAVRYKRNKDLYEKIFNEMYGGNKQ